MIECATKYTPVDLILDGHDHSKLGRRNGHETDLWVVEGASWQSPKFLAAIELIHRVVHDKPKDSTSPYRELKELKKQLTAGSKLTRHPITRSENGFVKHSPVV